MSGWRAALIAFVLIGLVMFVLHVSERYGVAKNDRAFVVIDGDSLQARCWVASTPGNPPVLIHCERAR